MAKYYHEFTGFGKDKSPLDLPLAVVNNDTNWEVKKTVYDATDNYLAELWVQSINTTSNQTLAIQMVYTGTEIEASFSRDTDVNLPIDQQPETPQNSLKNEGMLSNQSFIGTWGVSLNNTFTVVIIDRDFLHIHWQGNSHIGDKSTPPSYAPFYTYIYFGALDKSHNYLDGVVWMTNKKRGYRTVGLHFNEHWYQESGFGSGNSYEGLQALVNGLSNTIMYDQVYNAKGYYITPVALHANTSLDGANQGLELAGFLPNNTYVCKTYNSPNVLVHEVIKNKKYVMMPINTVSYVNTILFQID